MIRILQGDCVEVMAGMEPASVDSIVTDPPYELGFMGKGWDSTGVANDPATWRAALRVLKPGGHLLAFSGTRTYHRMVCAIEDAGFEIRDQIGWLYGSGFPKSLDVSKAIDKAAGLDRPRVPGGQGGTNSILGARKPGEAISGEAIDWQGWGTALKPAWEPVVVARKPLIGTVAANVLQHGTGALNIDGCRIGTVEDTSRVTNAAIRGGNLVSGRTEPGPLGGGHDLGRWPANVIHDGSDEVLAAFPQAPGQIADASSSSSSRKTQNVYGAMTRGNPAKIIGTEIKANNSGNGREGEPSADSENEGGVGFKMRPGARRGDEGSAARFFYTAKASRHDRNDGCYSLPKKPLNWSSGEQSPGTFQAEGTDRSAHNAHPTVKPTDLMRYLCRLVTPPGGTVLDPFMGSGSTLKAAELEGFSAIGIELDPAYIEIARRRIASDAPLFAEVA